MEVALALLRRRGFRQIAAALFAIVFTALSWPGGAQPRATSHPRDQIVIYVPAQPGGAWDQTAAVMKQALEAEGLARQVTIVYRPGAGGLIGLAQLIDSARGDPGYLFVGGSPTMGAAVANRSLVTLLDVTPIARLAGDYEAIAVPSSSSIGSLADLVRAIHDRPNGIAWVGGAVGGPEEGLARRLAAAGGADPRLISYQGMAGASDVAVTLAGGPPDMVGIAAQSVFAPHAAAGEIRILAMAAPGDAYRGVPTLRSAGLDLTAHPWWGVFAPPGVPEPEARRLSTEMSKMVASGVWRQALRDRGWTDEFLTGEAFHAFLMDEQQRDLALQNGARPSAPGGVARPALVWIVAAVGLGLACGLAILFVWRRIRRERRERREHAVREGLADIAALSPATGQTGTQSAHVLAINREFEGWGLSPAERDVAWLLIKGLPMSEIARVRGASERTVRQQAQAVYAKAELEGRSDLAGYILDRCLSLEA